MPFLRSLPITLRVRWRNGRETVEDYRVALTEQNGIYQFAFQRGTGAVVRVRMTGVQFGELVAGKWVPAQYDEVNALQAEVHFDLDKHTP